MENNKHSNTNQNANQNDQSNQSNQSNQTEQTNQTEYNEQEGVKISYAIDSPNPSYLDDIDFPYESDHAKPLNPHYVQTLHDDSIHSVEVQYSSRNPDLLYTYLTRLSLKKGDTVIIETPAGHYRTVTVRKFHKTPKLERTADINYKWIVSKVPTKKYKKTKKKNKTTIKKIKSALLKAQRKADLEKLTSSND